jgi:hypothetical protein
MPPALPPFGGPDPATDTGWLTARGELDRPSSITFSRCVFPILRVASRPDGSPPVSSPAILVDFWEDQHAKYPRSSRCPGHYHR